MNESTLYIVSTPIGNLSEISERALQVLKTSDFIICEDTRISLNLLNKFNIKKHLISYNKFTEIKKLDFLIEKIKQSKQVALVCDAGTPCIQDPGETLVRECYKEGIRVTSVSGPCAFISAVVISGLSTKRICFEGFLSVDKTEKYNLLNEIKHLKHTIVFYEAPHKLLKTLIDIYKVFGNRRVSIIKEISKIYENVFLTTFEEAIKYYEGVSNIKGEFVIVVEGANEDLLQNKNISFEEAVNIAKELVEKGYQKKDASKIVSLETGFKKSEIYKCLTK